MRKTLDDFKDQDLHQLEGDDLEDFLHAKEAQYEERRSRVERFCQDLRATGDSTLKRLSHVNPRYTQYNPEDGVGYCGIPKVRMKQVVN